MASASKWDDLFSLADGQSVSITRSGVALTNKKRRALQEVAAGNHPSTSTDATPKKKLTKRRNDAVVSLKARTTRTSAFLVEQLSTNIVTPAPGLVLGPSLWGNCAAGAKFSQKRRANPSCKQCGGSKS